MNNSLSSWQHCLNCGTFKDLSQNNPYYQFFYNIRGTDSAVSLCILLFSYLCKPEWFIPWCSSGVLLHAVASSHINKCHLCLPFQFSCCSFFLLMSLFAGKKLHSHINHMFIIYSRKNLSRITCWQDKQQWIQALTFRFIRFMLMSLAP